MRKFLIFISLILVSLGAKAFVVYGEAVAVGQGTAMAFADIDHSGNVNSMGVAMTPESMQGLPTHDMTQYILKLPSVLNIPPYSHLMIDWNPHGHEPDPIYGLAHFDFHFYIISEAERKAISCAGSDEAPCLTQPAPAELPPFYVPTPAGVREMGWHWLDPRSPEFSGQLFTATFIYGYYGGHLAFLEPMITRDFLMGKSFVEKDIPIPQVYPKAGFYPQAYSVEFNPTKNLHVIRLKKMFSPN